MQHAVGEQGGVLLAAEVEAPHLPRVPPLVEVGRGLVVLQPLDDWTVDHHLFENMGGGGGGSARLFRVGTPKPASGERPHIWGFVQLASG